MFGLTVLVDTAAVTALTAAVTWTVGYRFFVPVHPVGAATRLRPELVARTTTEPPAAG